MFPRDIFQRLPTPTALVLLSSLLELSSAHVLPRQTTTVHETILNVVNYPPIPAPTSPPIALDVFNELLRRQDTNTICGYIGGDPNLPATCSAGSHCVMDAEHGAVGCCPNGQDTCTRGVYTGCVDSNSGAQTVVNPYVFTCQGSDVCYKNVFEGGYSQFGCGTASDLATSVAASATGLTSDLDLSSASITFTGGSATGSPTSTSTSNPATTTGSTTGSTTSPDSSTTSRGATSTSTSSSSSSSSASSPSSSSSMTLTITSPTSSADPTSSGAQAAPTSSGYTVNRTAAIAGGTVGGAALLALLAASLILWRRRAARNARNGPGPRPGDTQYISPMSGRGGPGGGAVFSPVHQSQDGFERGMPFTPQPQRSVRGKPITHVVGGPTPTNFNQHPQGYHYPGQNPAAYAAAGAGAGVGAAGAYGAYAEDEDEELHHGDEVPLRQRSPEIEDFSRGFQDALSRIGEEDETELSSDSNGGNMNQRGSGDPNEDGARPLWLQTRRQSRNMMWT